MAYNARVRSCTALHLSQLMLRQTSEDLRTNTIPESLQMLWGAIIAVIVQCFLIKRTGYVRQLFRSPVNGADTALSSWTLTNT